MSRLCMYVLSFTAFACIIFSTCIIFKSFMLFPAQGHANVLYDSIIARALERDPRCQICQSVFSELVTYQRRHPSPFFEIVKGDVMNLQEFLTFGKLGLFGRKPSFFDLIKYDVLHVVPYNSRKLRGRQILQSYLGILESRPHDVEMRKFVRSELPRMEDFIVRLEDLSVIDWVKLQFVLELQGFSDLYALICPRHDLGSLACLMPQNIASSPCKQSLNELLFFQNISDLLKSQACHDVCEANLSLYERIFLTLWRWHRKYNLNIHLRWVRLLNANMFILLYVVGFTVILVFYSFDTNTAQTSTERAQKRR